MNIESKSGTIRVTIPKSQKGEFRVFAADGGVTSNIPKKIGNEEHVQSLNEIVGSNEVTISLKAENGDINVFGN